MGQSRLAPGHYQAEITHILPASYVEPNTGRELDGIFVGYKTNYERFSVLVSLSGFPTSRLSRVFGKLCKAHGHRPGELLGIASKLVGKAVGLEVRGGGVLEFYRLPFDDVPSSVDDAFPDLKALEV